MKGKVLVIGLLILAVALSGCLQSEPVPSGPVPSGTGIVPQSWEYCSQFSEAECNGQIYTHVYENGVEDTVECGWNNNTTNCDAGIGYQ